MVNPTDTELSRLRCFLFFEDEDDTKPRRGRIETWCTGVLQEMYDLDKEISRKLSTLAIPQLLNEINYLRQPRKAEKRFKFKTALGPCLTPGSPVEIVDCGDDESIEDYIKRILRRPGIKYGGSGS